MSAGEGRGKRSRGEREAWVREDERRRAEGGGGTYAVQMEGVRRARGVHRGGEGDLDGRVDRELVDAAGRQEVLGGLGTAQDLEEDGHGGRDEGGVVNGEVVAVEVEDQVDCLVDATRGRSAGL